jgi:hypothetical protein
MPFNVQGNALPGFFETIGFHETLYEVGDARQVLRRLIKCAGGIGDGRKLGTSLALLV